MISTYKGSDKLSYVIANDYRLLQVMSRFGISLGFGEKTISDVCRQCDVDTDTFLAVINYISGSFNSSQTKVESISVPSLLTYLKGSHRYFLEYLFPNIRFNLLNAIDCSVKNEVAFLVLKFYDAYVEEVSKHMDYEESNVFTYVQQLIKGESVTIEGGHLLSRHNESINTKLKELKNLFMQYYPQKENNDRLNAVIIAIYQCEEDLDLHCQIEDNIFVPAVRRLEHQNRQKKSVTENYDYDVNTQSGTVLSDREKDIVICVAKGMSNKEIADKLFLSVNTVTTHRRNIARKLQIHSSAGITIYAIVNKLVTLSEVNM
mgnify:CR=1 FL=1